MKIVIGISPQEQIRARALAIARGEYKPKRGEPKIWFPSMKSAAEVLSDKNRKLLRMIADEAPESIADLARSAGRAPGNLSRTLNTLARYGFVELQPAARGKRPVVLALDFEIHAAA